MVFAFTSLDAFKSSMLFVVLFTSAALVGCAASKTEVDYKQLNGVRVFVTQMDNSDSSVEVAHKYHARTESNVIDVTYEELLEETNQLLGEYASGNSECRVSLKIEDARYFTEGLLSMKRVVVTEMLLEISASDDDTSKFYEEKTISAHSGALNYSVNPEAVAKGLIPIALANVSINACVN